MSTYKISVILAVYNVEKFIDEAFQSLLRQTIGFSNLEVIFVDDKSTDASGTIIDRYAGQYENVTALHLEENSGYCGKPRNTALDICSGEYIMFLDPDDLYFDRACESLYQAARETGCDIASGYHNMIDEEGRLVFEKGFPYERFSPFTVQSIEESPEIILLRVALWAKIFNRTFWEKHHFRFDETIPGQDAVVGVDALIRAHGICYLETPIVKFRVRDGENASITHTVSIKKYEGLQKAFAQVFQILSDAGKESLYPLLTEGFVPFNVYALMDSSMEKEPLITCLRIIYDVMRGEISAWDKEKEKIISYIQKFISQQQYEEAAEAVLAFRPSRRYSLDLLKANKYFQDKITQLQVGIDSLNNMDMLSLVKRMVRRVIPQRE